MARPDRTRNSRVLPPMSRQHDDRTDGGGHGSVRPADAALGQDGSEPREERGSERERYPHSNRLPFSEDRDMPCWYYSTSGSAFVL